MNNSIIVNAIIKKTGDLESAIFNTIRKVSDNVISQLAINNILSKIAGEGFYNRLPLSSTSFFLMRDDNSNLYFVIDTDIYSVNLNTTLL